MAPRTARSPSPTSAPAHTRCMPLPTACWANTRRPTSPSRRARTLDLGKLEWKPVRYGKQVWEIGYPNRNGGEFFKGDEYWLWGWCMRYALLVPQRHHLHHRQERLAQGLVLRASAARDESTAWSIPPPRTRPTSASAGSSRPTAAGQDMWRNRAGAGRPPGPSNSIWTRPPKGTATLRVSLGGADSTTPDHWRQWPGSGRDPSRLDQRPALQHRPGRVAGIFPALQRARCLKAGENEMTLTVPAGELTSGVCYDYLRLETGRESNIRRHADAQFVSPL